MRQPVSSASTPQLTAAKCKIRPSLEHRDPQTLRRLLEADGHHSGRNRIRCLHPQHDDHHPSATVYDGPEGGHVYCFACGFRLDAYEYLVQVRGLAPREALEWLDGPSLPAGRRTRPFNNIPKSPAPTQRVRTCTDVQLPSTITSNHLGRVARINHIPVAISDRGFDVGDLRRLLVASDRGGAVLAITGPSGHVLRLKRRRPNGEVGGDRYHYVDDQDSRGLGAPSWCSPAFGSASLVLVIEGELNGMAAWLARPTLDVVGVAGTNGSLPFRVLVGREVVVYADADRHGEAARERWAQTLHDRGCRVSILPPWIEGDACDIAGRHGRAELRARLS